MNGKTVGVAMWYLSEASRTSDSFSVHILITNSLLYFIGWLADIGFYERIKDCPNFTKPKENLGLSNGMYLKSLVK